MKTLKIAALFVWMCLTTLYAAEASIPCANAWGVYQVGLSFVVIVVICIPLGIVTGLVGVSILEGER